METVPVDAGIPNCIVHPFHHQALQARAETLCAPLQTRELLQQALGPTGLEESVSIKQKLELAKLQKKQ
jgi:hypothetical protein